MQESFWWWQCSDRYIIPPPGPHLNTPFPLSPSLINLMVSADVKHHVYTGRTEWGHITDRVKALEGLSEGIYRTEWGYIKDRVTALEGPSEGRYTTVQSLSLTGVTVWAGVRKQRVKKDRPPQPPPPSSRNSDGSGSLMREKARLSVPVAMKGAFRCHDNAVCTR